MQRVILDRINAVTTSVLRTGGIGFDIQLNDWAEIRINHLTFFGSQVIHHGSHALFLKSRAVFVIV